ncbi:MAG: CPBP family intramembrane glutamic endopeptidase [Pseudomonadota bacterium]
MRPRKRRLQRDRDFTGDRLTSFRDVLLRHGLPGLGLALCLLTLASLQIVFLESVSGAFRRPGLHLIGFVGIFIALNAYRWSLDRTWSPAQMGWILYLGALSLWEEWVFRFAFPHILEGWGLSVWIAAALSALMFGALHYFTLRWKWQWCVGACLGGLYFSYQVELHGDLLWVAAIHWIATSFNTPKPPGPSAGEVG